MPDNLDLLLGVPTLTQWGAQIDFGCKPPKVTFKNINNVTISAITGSDGVE